jgi:hypothetical protein
MMGTPILSKPIYMTHYGNNYAIVIEGTKEETCIITAFAILTKWHDKGYKNGHPFFYGKRKTRVWIRCKFNPDNWTNKPAQLPLFPMVSQ